MTDFSRQQFIRSALSSSASMLSSTTLGSLSSCARAYPKIYAPTPPRVVLADLHVHPLRDDWIERSAAFVRLPGVARLLASRLNQTRGTWEEYHRALRIAKSAGERTIRNSGAAPIANANLCNLE